LIPIYNPYLPKHSLRYAHEAIESTWISSSGKFIDIATERLREYLGVKYVQLVSSGTAATHLVAKSLTYKHPEVKKVIMPNNVYVAAWNAFLYDKELEIIPIDADLETWYIDLLKLSDMIGDSNGDTAVCFVHNLGNIIDVPRFSRDNPEVPCVEDNCEGFGGEYGDNSSGTKSLASSISFFGNKTITSGEGGAFITNDREIYDFVKCIHGQGQRSGAKYIHDNLGYNYRMTNIQAAILLGQLEVLPEIIERKNIIFEMYRKHFSSMPGISFQIIDGNTSPSNWMMAIRIDGVTCYEESSHFLSDHGIETRPMFYPISSHKHLAEHAGPEEEKVSSKLNRECVILPSFPDLCEKEVLYIIESVGKLARKKQNYIS